MKSSSFILTLALSLGGAMFAGRAADDVKGRLDSYGLGKPDGPSRREGPTAKAPGTTYISGYAIFKQTNIIPAKIGVDYGITFSVLGLPANEQVKLKRVLTCPPMKLPSGNILTEDIGEIELTSTEDGTVSSLVGWVFVADYELVPGNWRYQIWYQDKLVLEKWFRVVAPADAKGAPKAKPVQMSAKELAAAWADLASREYAKADQAWGKFSAAGENAIPFFREQIRKHAVPKVDTQAISKQIAALDSDNFQTRERALKELTAAGEVVIDPLRRLLDKNPSAEARERANGLLKHFRDQPPTAERQRVSVAMELLVQLGTDKAVGLLEEISREALVPQIRLEANKAMESVLEARLEKE